jgi:hypothetical protein
MALASWYSIYKMLPDAEISVACKRTNQLLGLFQWVNKLGVKFFQFSKNYSGFEDKIIINPTTMAIRPYEDKLGPISVKSLDTATLVDYSQGCGSFNTSEWIHKIDTPFNQAVERFATDNITVNELKVLKIWQRLNQLYALL